MNRDNKRFSSQLTLCAIQVFRIRCRWMNPTTSGRESPVKRATQPILSESDGIGLFPAGMRLQPFTNPPQERHGGIQ